MANKDHLDMLRRGVMAWNEWRDDHPDTKLNLGGADITGTLYGVPDIGAVFIGASIDLRTINLRNVYLEEANLSGADLRMSNVRGANFTAANLSSANLSGLGLQNSSLVRANLLGANLNGANLQRADLYRANLTRASLVNANLTSAKIDSATFVETDVQDADFTGCSVYGTSIWNLQGTPSSQSGLIISSFDGPTITVDNLKVAQFLYLMLNNYEIHDLIDTITSRVVLILGRFTIDRKPILDALLDALRERGYTPVLFDFEKPSSRSYKESVSMLAHMSRFVVADLTDPRVVLQELELIVPHLKSVPVQTIVQSGGDTSSVVDDDYSDYPWFLPTVTYESVIDVIGPKVVEQAEVCMANYQSRGD